MSDDVYRLRETAARVRRSYTDHQAADQLAQAADTIAELRADASEAWEAVDHWRDRNRKRVESLRKARFELTDRDATIRQLTAERDRLTAERARYVLLAEELADLVLDDDVHFIERWGRDHEGWSATLGRITPQNLSGRLADYLLRRSDVSEVDATWRGVRTVPAPTIAPGDDYEQ